MYLKRHSEGEFCEELEWIKAAVDLQISPWPRLFVGVPYTPHLGRRLIAATWLGEAHRRVVEELLLQTLVELSKASQLSVNVAFSTQEEGKCFERSGFVKRYTWQAWWTNHQPVPYANFAEFLSKLKAKKAHTMRRQRNEIGSIEGLQLELIDGASKTGRQISTGLMSEVWHCCYKSTQVRHSQELLAKYDKDFIITHDFDLNERFFKLLAERFRHHVLLVLAWMDGHLVGGSLSFSNGTCICGRYWGYPLGVESVRYLHFECCYHRLIDHAIECGCHHIEPGNGGDSIFKVQRDRGFEPVATPSYHFIPDSRLRAKIEQLAAANIELPSWASPSRSVYS